MATKITTINIEKFRRLKNLEIKLADRITLICGKNSTAKSTILGIIAQVFNFEKDYKKNEELSYTTISGKQFKSVFSDHFRFSPKTDKPGSMNLNFEVFDAYQNKTVKARLELSDSSDRKNSRPIVRQLDENGKILFSRNFTHPVIHLGLGRLMPIALRKQYNEAVFEYLEQEENNKEFRFLTNRILLKMHRPAKKVTPTKGSIFSTVAHGDEYDQDSVSAGEDNVGQIVLALLSFKKLKEEYMDYHGGTLLIDEADAGLYPGAQEEFIKVLNEYATKYNLQVVMTSHSPIMINNVLKLGKVNSTLYLTDSYGDIEIKTDWNWNQIECDLFVKTANDSSALNIPKIDFYFEDQEAIDFHKKILYRSKLNKHIRIMQGISLGCSNYKDLASKKIPTFYNESVIVLDGDQRGGKKFKNFLFLPTQLAPDQLLYLILNNLDEGDYYWRENPKGTTKAIFSRAAQEISNTLDIVGHLSEEEFNQKIINYQNNNTSSSNQQKQGKLRRKFKDFYNHVEIKKLININGQYNPFLYYLKTKPNLSETYINNMQEAMEYVLTSSKGFTKTFIEQNYFN